MLTRRHLAVDARALGARLLPLVAAAALAAAFGAGIAYVVGSALTPA